MIVVFCNQYGVLSPTALATCRQIVGGRERGRYRANGIRGAVCWRWWRRLFPSLIELRTTT